MAVDTRNQRFSLVGLAQPTVRVLPNPDGTVDRFDRFQFSFTYAGDLVAHETRVVGLDVYASTAAGLDAYASAAAGLDAYAAAAAGLDAYESKAAGLDDVL